MRKLALHQITAMEASPIELVSIAAETGCSEVCIFVRSPLVPKKNGEMGPLFPTVFPDMKDAMLERLAACGVGIMNIEYFPVEADTDVETYREPLRFGAELGAVRAVAHFHDTDEARGLANFGRLCDIAAEYGLKVGLEFMGLSPGCNSLARAREILAKLDRPNLGIAIDALHLVRTGSTVEEVAALKPEQIAYSQICDGMHLEKSSDYLPEALNRAFPGEGVFPLRALMAALPADASLDVEVPSEDLRRQGVSGLDRARKAVNASRSLLAEAGVG